MKTVLKDTWKLHSSKLIGATMDYPGHTDHFLDADCEIIVGEYDDSEESDYRGQTIDDYLDTWINDCSVDDLSFAYITIDDCVRGNYKKLKYLPVTKGMKIFIHSERWSN